MEEKVTLSYNQLRALQHDSALKIQALWKGYIVRSTLSQCIGEFEHIFLETEQSAAAVLAKAYPPSVLPRTTLLWRPEAQCVVSAPLYLNDAGHWAYMYYPIQLHANIANRREWKSSRGSVVTDDVREQEVVNQTSTVDIDETPANLGRELLRTDEIAVFALNDGLDYECVVEESDGQQSMLVSSPARRVEAPSTIRPVLSPARPVRSFTQPRVAQTPVVPTILKKTPVVPTILEKKVDIGGAPRVGYGDSPHHVRGKKEEDRVPQIGYAEEPSHTTQPKVPQKQQKVLPKSRKSGVDVKDVVEDIVPNREFLTPNDPGNQPDLGSPDSNSSESSGDRKPVPAAGMTRDMVETELQWVKRALIDRRAQLRKKI